MSAERDPRLPDSVDRLIDEWIAGSGIDDEAAREVRADLERHFLDGFDAGRSEEELLAAFGDPASTAPLLKRAVTARGGSRRWSTSRAWGTGALASDLRQAVRFFRSSPAFTVTVVLVLALGIGANALTFTVLNEVLLEPLPVEDPSTLVNVLSDIPGGNSFLGFSVADFETLREQNQVLVDLVAYSGIRLRHGEPPSAERVVATMASPSYFDLLGVSAAVGSVDLPAFTGWGADEVVVVSHAFWRSRLGSDPSVVGSTLRLDGRPLTVVGVAAEGFSGTFIGFPSDVWLPLSAAATFVPGFAPEDRSGKFLELMGRRRGGVSIATVDAGLDAIAADIERAYPEVNRGHRVRVVRMTGIDDSLRVGVLGFVAILTAIALLVLVIACLNVGGMLLARAMSRERELAIRLALGAGAGRLVRQLLTETALITVVGTGVALVLATRSARALSDFFRTVSGGLGLELELAWRVVGLTVFVAAGSALIAGVVPGLHVLGKHPAGVLRQGGSAARRVGRARGALVGAQVALSVVLVIAAGLFTRALFSGLRVDPGFDADGVAVVPFTLDGDRFAPDAARLLQRQVRDELRARPGIASVALSEVGPLGVARSPARVAVAGVEAPPGEDGFLVDVRVVGSGYFETVGIGLAEGEGFGPDADDPEAGVAVVSRAFVERFLDGRPAVGASIDVGANPSRIVGVAEDVRYLVQDESPDPLVYVPMGARHLERVQLLFRSAASPAGFRAILQEILSATDGDQPAVTLRTARETLSDALLPQRVAALVVGVMGALALVLAALGLHGLVQYTVSREARAHGIRVALGGGPWHVLALVLGRGYALVGLGLAVGGGVALLLAPVLRPFLVDVGPRDPGTYASVVVAFALVGLGAMLAPALRATRVDPAETLRTD